MAEKTADAKTGSWSSTQARRTIEYPLELLDEIRLNVNASFHANPRGGVEAGGLLFGVRSEGVVRVAAWRPISCEHSRGFGFLLSERDLIDLAQLMQNAKSDHDLKDYEVVGWFVSHTRSDLAMSPSDLTLFDQCFPAPWQFTLVLRPGNLAPTKAAFTVRDESGRVCRHDPASEFTVEPLRQARVHGQAPLQETDTATAVAARPRTGLVPAPRAPNVTAGGTLVRRPNAAVSARGPLEGPRFLRERQRPKSKLRWLWLIPFAASLVLGALFVKERFFTTPPLAPASIALRLEDSGGQLGISWDKESASVKAADRGVIEINDGGKSESITLERSQVSSGSTTYARRTGDVKVKLSLFQPNNSMPVSELAQFVGPRPGESTDDRRSWEKQRSDLQAQIKTLRAQLARESAKSQQLSKLVSILQQRLRALQR